MPWLVRFDGEALNTEDLTFNELEAISQVSGTPWVLINPVRNATEGKLLVALLLTRKGMSDEDATAKVGALTMRQLRDVFEFTEEGADLPTEWADGLPKAEDAAPTSGSSGPGESSAGIPT